MHGSLIALNIPDIPRDISTLPMWKFTYILHQFWDQDFPKYQLNK
jgi:hypothetical protein